MPPSRTQILKKLRLSIQLIPFLGVVLSFIP
jgi:hypothetical protein